MTPRIYLVGRPNWTDQIYPFLYDQQVQWSLDPEASGAEILCEMAGRLCYMSYGKGRRTNRSFIDHIISVGHGSVLEHATWNFIITGVSRSFTHELVRHRHFAFSQLSQRYVDESKTEFIEPDVIKENPLFHAVWETTVNLTKEAYKTLTDGLDQYYKAEPDSTLRRKLARQAARSVLPNATETRIFVTGNARAIRHFIEVRGSEYADVEMRKVALMLLSVMQVEAPAIFGDYRIESVNGVDVIRTPHVKV